MQHTLTTQTFCSYHFSCNSLHPLCTLWDPGTGQASCRGLLKTSGLCWQPSWRCPPANAMTTTTRCCAHVAQARAARRASMLPVSGAEQLKISDANTTRPMTWLRYAYSCARRARAVCARVGR